MRVHFSGTQPTGMVSKVARAEQLEVRRGTKVIMTPEDANNRVGVGAFKGGYVKGGYVTDNLVWFKPAHHARHAKQKTFPTTGFMVKDQLSFEP